MTTPADEFVEVSHCGGVVTIFTTTGTQAEYALTVLDIRARGWKSVAVFFIAVLPEGIPIRTLDMEWAPDRKPSGQPFQAITMAIASDRQGCFGRQCYACGKYWRSDAAPARWLTTCPYCIEKDEAHRFLTEGQLAFVRKVCEQVHEALWRLEDGQHSIDLDQIVDEVSQGAARPDFLTAEVTQQSRFKCSSCGAFNDILGKFGSCSCCGTRNNQAVFKAECSSLRQDVSASRALSDVLRDTVSRF